MTLVVVVSNYYVLLCYVTSNYLHMGYLILLPIVLLHLIFKEFQASPYECFIITLNKEISSVSDVQITVTSQLHTTIGSTKHAYFLK